MDQKWLENFQEEVSALAAKAKEFDTGSLPRKDYKGFSGGMGSYAQRELGKHMLRLRMAGGRLTKERLGFLVNAVSSYDVPKMKMTTCQTVQLHDLSSDNLPELMMAATGVGIYTRGGGGDGPRNVMASPLSGVQQGEFFDVMPYAEATAEYLLSICRELHMPRKLKIAFCNGADDCCHSEFRDMGFQAQKDGSFRVLIAGGLGNNHRMGVEMFENLPPVQILYAVRAMIETFCQHGCYTNRAKARTRYLQETLGADGLKDAFMTNFHRLLTEGGLECKPAAMQLSKTGHGTICGERVIPQKQEGLYCVSYHPVGGLLPPDKCKEIHSAILDMEGAECRIAPNETLYIINLTAQEAAKVLDITNDGAVTPFEQSVACIGGSICQLGIRDSQAVLRACIEAVREAGLPANALPKIAICGCPSSCAAPQSAAIGLMGASKSVEGKVQSAFKVYFGGCDTLGKACFGELIATVPEKDLPMMFVELGKATGGDWQKAMEAHASVLADVIRKFD